MALNTGERTLGTRTPDDSDAWRHIVTILGDSESAVTMHGRHMCHTECGRWAVFEVDGHTPVFVCPICMTEGGVREVNMWWRWKQSSFSRRSGLRTALAVTDVSEIVFSFLQERPSRYDSCCRCDDWNRTPCLDSWFDRGWVCPD